MSCSPLEPDDPRLRALDPARRALFERLRSLQPPQQAVPLSAAQLSIWLQYRQAPARLDYNLGAAFVIEGVLLLDAFRRSFDALCARYRQLGFRVRDGDPPLQLPGAPPELEVIEAGDDPAALDRAIEACLRRPFELATEPMLRACLVRHAPDRDTLLACAHHLALDGWSVEQLLTELAKEYTAALAGEGLAQGPDAPVPDSGSAAADSAALEEWWRLRLSGADMTFARRLADRPDACGRQGATRSRNLRPTTRESLAALAQSLGTTPFAVIATAILFVVSHRTGDTDLLVAMPVAGRSDAMAARSIGLFACATLLRVAWNGDPPFAELVRLTSAALADTLARADLPMERLAALMPNKAARQPAKVSIGFEPQRMALRLPGLRVMRLELDPAEVPIDLSLVLRQGADTTSLAADFRTAPFDLTTVEALLDDIVRLLERCLEAPSIPVSQLLKGGLVALTPVQQQMWAGQKMAPTTPAYNQSVVVDLPGSLDPNRFAAAWEAVARRCDTLCARFVERDGTPRQRLAIAAPPLLEIVDLSCANDQHAAWRQLLDRVADMPFALDKEVARSVLARLGPDRQRWLLCVHHLCIDGRSFVRLAHAVLAEAEGEPPVTFDPFEPLARNAEPAPPAACAAPGELSFFGQSPASLPLRTVTRPVQLGPGARSGLAALLDLAGRRSFSPAMAASAVFVGIWAALLQRFCGAAELYVGLPVHNRTAANEAVIGPLMDVRTVALSPRPWMTPAELVAASQAAIGVALRTGAKSPAGKSARHSYSTIVNVEPSAEIDFFGGSWRLCFQSAAAWEPLTFHAAGEGADWELSLDFADALFDDVRQAQVMALLEDLFAAGLTPDRPLWDWDRVVAGARVEAYPAPDRDPLDAFFEVVRTAPRAPAIETDGLRWDYALLAERAGRLASRLAQAGAGPGSTVAVRLPRSADQVLCWLAVWLAGATCQPLNPGLSEEATLRLVEASSASLLVANTAQALPGMTRIEPGELGDAPLEPRERPPALPALALSTSGTIGVPRVVLVTHGALATYLEGASKAYGIRARDRVVQFAAPGFDAAAEEIVLVLASGATLLSWPASSVPLPAHFLRWAALRNATVLDLPTGYWHVLTAALEPLESHLWPELRLVIIGGEEAGAEPWRRWQVAAPRVTLVNSYGPTETTIVTSAHVGRGKTLAAGAPPIGQPLAGVSYHLLDEHLLPVPDGVPGELWIGGPQVSLGYVQQAGATAARFLPDPFCATLGARLYRTGDRARLSSNGELEFLGRVDRETKVGGRRVSCDAIERLLLAAPGVGQALIRTSRDGASAVLEAWIVTLRGANSAAVRKAAADALPTGLPLRIGVVERLPLTQNGKLDRLALPGLVEPHRSVPKMPHGALMAKVIEGIAELSGCPPEQIDPERSIFSLGLDSLRALQLFTRLDAALRVSSPATQLFDEPTPATIARLYAETFAAATGELGEEVAALDETQLESRIADLPAPIAGPSASETEGSPLPLLPAQEEIWALQQVDPTNSTWNVTSAVLLDGPLDIDRFRLAVHRLAERHEPLRTRFRLDCETLVQEVLPADAHPIPVTRIDVAGRDVLAEAQERAKVEARRPFELKGAPLCRILVVDDGRAPAVVISLHHIVCDGWSAGIMVRELHALYQSDLPLPPLPTRYAEAVRRICSAMRRGELAGEEAYWLEALAGLPEQQHPLPPDAGASANPSGEGATIRFLIDRERLERWRGSAAGGATLHALLVATLAATLGRLGGMDDIAIGTPEAGRHLPAEEELIGLFVNTLVLRVRMRDSLPLSKHLRQVTELCRGALANRRAAPTRLSRKFGRNPDEPLFRVMLTLFNEPTRSGIPDKWQRIELERGKANRELTLRFEPQGKALAGYVEFRVDLYLPETIERFVAFFLETFDAVVAGTGTLGDLGSGVKTGSRSKSELRERLQRVRRGEVWPAGQEGALPVVLHAGRSGRDAAEWIAAEREILASYLRREGAVLLRGFEVVDAGGFERAARALGGELAAYSDQSTPRTHISGGVYTSTEYPRDRAISMHNEMAYSVHWPRHLVMFCHTPAAEGGATPLADSRAVLRRLDPALVARFRSAGVTYIRNFMTALDLPWTRAFGTTDRGEAERLFAAQGIDWTWHKGDRLTLRQTRPATAVHPKTAEECWFNVAHIFHPAGQDPTVAAALCETLDRESLPRDATLGDGRPISNAEVAAIHEAYRVETVRFDWQAGDLLLLDNLLVAHGRDPFRGERLHWVAMTGAGG